MCEEAHGPSQRIQHKTQHGLQEGEVGGSAKGNRPQGHGATWYRSARGGEGREAMAAQALRAIGLRQRLRWGEGAGWSAPHEPSGQ